MSIIEVNELVKNYKVKENQPGFFSNLFSNKYTYLNAVNDISFSIEEGEIVGYIGPNGAGKSTTIKMLTGILVPTEGNIIVDGIVPYKNRKVHAQNIGVVFGQRTQLWWELPVIDSLNLLRHIYKVPEKTYKENLKTFDDILGLSEFINKPVRQLSLGQRMRADFAASLLHDPKILFLDEPTIGLDIVVKDKILDFIYEINKEKNITVILTTHDVKDIERLCNRAIVLDKGAIVYNGSIAKMKEDYSKYRVVIVELMDKNTQIQIANAEVIKEDGPKKWLRLDKEVTNSAHIIAELMNKYEIKDISIEDDGIEDIIKQIYTEPSVHHAGA
ncbi:MAG: ATP-binding cassette domain-containing protein [Floccifex sp.]